MKVRSLFISDLHIGSRRFQAKKFICFLKTIKADNIFLVGDIFDQWFTIFQWTPECDKVVRALMKTKAMIYYCPGNHDALFRKYSGIPRFENLIIGDWFVYNTVKDKLIYVVHGDRYDTLCMSFLVWVSHIFGSVTLSKFYSRWFKKKALQDIRDNNYHAIICAHTHEPEIDGDYMNTGDWVGHTTAIVEYNDGNFELINV